jgi:hypothetical protein
MTKGSTHKTGARTAARVSVGPDADGPAQGGSTVCCPSGQTIPVAHVQVPEPVGASLRRVPGAACSRSSSRGLLEAADRGVAPRPVRHRPVPGHPDRGLHARRTAQGVQAGAVPRPAPRRRGGELDGPTACPRTRTPASSPERSVPRARAHGATPPGDGASPRNPVAGEATTSPTTARGRRASRDRAPSRAGAASRARLASRCGVPGRSTEPGCPEHVIVVAAWPNPPPKRSHPVLSSSRHRHGFVRLPAGRRVAPPARRT